MKRYISLAYILMVFLNWGSIANSNEANIPEFDGVYIRTQEDEYIKLNENEILIQPKEGALLEPFPENVVARNEQVSPLITRDEESIIHIPSLRFKGILVKGLYDFTHFDLSFLKIVKVSITQPEIPLLDVYTMGDKLKVLSKSMGENSYYFQPTDKLADARFIISLDNTAWIFSTEPSEIVLLRRLIMVLLNDETEHINNILQDISDIDQRIPFEILKEYIPKIDQKFDGITALMLATMGWRISSAKTFIEYGADVNLESKYGYTALIIAEASANNEMITLLKENGAYLRADQEVILQKLRREITLEYMVDIGGILAEYKNNYGHFPIQNESGDWNNQLIEPVSNTGVSHRVSAEQDGWGTSFIYLSDGNSYYLTSYGADKIKEGNMEFDRDIIFSNGKLLEVNK